MTLRSLLAAAVLLLSAAPLAAQVTLAPGTRVRVSAPITDNGVEMSGSRAWKVGTVVRADASLLTLQLSDGELSLPLSSLRGLEVSRGESSTRDAQRRGARLGAIVGAGTVAGFAAAAIVFDGRRGCDEYDGAGYILCTGIAPSNGEFVRNLAVGAVVGGGLGVLFGSRAREEWSPVVLPGMQLSVVPGARTTGLALSMRF